MIKIILNFHGNISNCIIWISIAYIISILFINFFFLGTNFGEKAVFYLSNRIYEQVNSTKWGKKEAFPTTIDKKVL